MLFICELSKSCYRSYLSERDLEAHVAYRHRKKRKQKKTKETTESSVINPNDIADNTEVVDDPKIIVPEIKQNDPIIAAVVSEVNEKIGELQKDKNEELPQNNDSPTDPNSLGNIQAVSKSTHKTNAKQNSDKKSYSNGKKLKVNISNNDDNIFSKMQHLINEKSLHSQSTTHKSKEISKKSPNIKNPKVSIDFLKATDANKKVISSTTSDIKNTKPLKETEVEEEPNLSQLDELCSVDIKEKIKNVEVSNPCVISKEEEVTLSQGIPKANEHHLNISPTSPGVVPGEDGSDRLQLVIEDRPPLDQHFDVTPLHQPIEQTSVDVNKELLLEEGHVISVKDDIAKVQIINESSLPIIHHHITEEVSQKENYVNDSNKMIEIESESISNTKDGHIIENYKPKEETNSQVEDNPESEEHITQDQQAIPLSTLVKQDSNLKQKPEDNSNKSSKQKHKKEKKDKKKEKDYRKDNGDKKLLSQDETSCKSSDKKKKNKKDKKHKKSSKNRHASSDNTAKGENRKMQNFIAGQEEIKSIMLENENKNEKTNDGINSLQSDNAVKLLNSDNEINSFLSDADNKSVNISEVSEKIDKQTSELENNLNKNSDYLNVNLKSKENAIVKSDEESTDINSGKNSLATNSQDVSKDDDKSDNENTSPNRIDYNTGETKSKKKENEHKTRKSKKKHKHKSHKRDRNLSNSSTDNKKHSKYRGTDNSAKESGISEDENHRTSRKRSSRKDRDELSQDRRSLQDSGEEKRYKTRSGEERKQSSDNYSDKRPVAVENKRVRSPSPGRRDYGRDRSTNHIPKLLAKEREAVFETRPIQVLGQQTSYASSSYSGRSAPYRDTNSPPRNQAMKVPSSQTLNTSNRDARSTFDLRSKIPRLQDARTSYSTNPATTMQMNNPPVNQYLPNNDPYTNRGYFSMIIIIILDSFALYNYGKFTCLKLYI